MFGLSAAGCLSPTKILHRSKHTLAFPPESRLTYAVGQTMLSLSEMERNGRRWRRQRRRVGGVRIRPRDVVEMTTEQDV